jgi:competence protein ComEC
VNAASRRNLILGGLAGSGALVLGSRLAKLAEPPPRRFFPPESLVVAAVNVGQGESSWIKTPSGQFLVIGTGPEASAEPLVRSLRQAGATRVDLLILPTPYRESIGGVPGLAEAFPIDQAFDNGWTEIINSSHRAARAALDERRIPLYAARAGQRFRLAQGNLEILHPSEPLVAQSPEAGNNSVVVRLHWDSTRFLWAGSLDRQGEEALLSRSESLDAQWLRVARFGTDRASSPEWLRAVSPEHAVVSVGTNTSGLPSPDTLGRLQASGARIYRTDETRDAWIFLSDGETITVSG